MEVKLVDANVLIYAINSEAAHHEEAKLWLDNALVDSEALGFTWIVLLAFLRIITHPAVFDHPIGVDVAGDIVEAWLDQPAALVVHPTARQLSILRGFLGTEGSAGNLVSDAHLAALAIEHGATVISYDSDFARFSGVSHRRPHR